MDFAFVFVREGWMIPLYFLMTLLLLLALGMKRERGDCTS
jgi:hypothetical protein